MEVEGKEEGGGKGENSVKGRLFIEKPKWEEH